MPTIKILPHTEYAPQGKTISAPAGTSICEALLDNGVNIEHACDMSCACTTCHVIVREGFNSLNEPDETEEDLLDPVSPVVPGHPGAEGRDDRDPEVHDQPRQRESLTPTLRRFAGRCPPRGLIRLGAARRQIGSTAKT